MQSASKMAGDEVLNEFGDFMLIDNLVRAYPGTYTHDQVFEMDLVFVYELIYINRVRDYLTSKTGEIHRQIEKAKNK